MNQGDCLCEGEVVSVCYKLELKLPKGELKIGLVRRRRQTEWCRDIYMLTKKGSLLKPGREYEIHQISQILRCHEILK